jgi:SIR2-like domain
MPEPELEWCLVADGLALTALTELCSSLKEQYGQAVAILAEPRLPICRLRISGQVVELKSQLADEERPVTPIEMSSAFRVKDDAPLVPLVASSVSGLLTRTVRYLALVQAVRSKRAIAFIGSGLSRDAGYPDWSQLLQALVAAAELDCSLEDLAAGGERALAIAQECKEKLQQEYYELLRGTFGEKVPGHSTIHVDLLRMPFASYMTTNIDPCLDLAGERVPGREIQVWPIFSDTRVGGGDIFYLHGKVPRPGQQCNVEQVRLTTDDYKEAYEDTAYISSLIALAIKESYVLVFIGYGLREPAITAVLKAAWEQKKKMAEHISRFGLKVDQQQVHFALLPEGEVAPDGVAALLRDCNIEVLEYSVKGGNFEEFNRMLVDLLRRTVDVVTPRVRFPAGVSSIDEGENLS